MNLKACAALTLGLAGLIAASGCESKQFVFPLAPQVIPVAVRVEGRVVDADLGAPVPGAIVSAGQVCPPEACNGSFPNQPGPIATADAQGNFFLALTLPPDWRSSLLDVKRDGYEPNLVSVGASESLDALLTLYQRITIRSGESIETRVSSVVQSCGWDDWPCRRVVVASQSGRQMTLEVIPLEGQTELGLVPGPQWTHPIRTLLQRQVITSASEVWIYGGVGKVRLIASPR